MYTFVRPGEPSAALLDEVAHGVDAVVGGRVELVDVEERARLDGHARVAHAARLAVAAGCSQLRALARMRAVDVLPVPRGPLNR